MADTLAGRRVLVLGATGFLGTAVVRHLVDAQATVSVLVRGKPRDSEFVRTRLFERVTVVGGMIEDTVRLRQILAIHDVDTIFQCAAGERDADTHALTHATITAAATVERKPAIVVPLRSDSPSKKLKFQTYPNARLDVVFVRLPDLFGAGDANVGRWPASMFLRAARDEALLPPPRDGGVCELDAGARGLVEAAFAEREHSSTGCWVDVSPTQSKRELFKAVWSQCESVRSTMLWYRANEARFGNRMSLRSAA